MEPPIIHTKIHTIRGQRVMLDFDLTQLYEVETRALNQGVRRNLRRFPQDFMFQLSPLEWDALRSQFVTALPHSSQIVMSYSKNRGIKYTPFAFTEQGVAMLSSVLRSEKAVDTNIAIMRAFIALRRYASVYDELAQKIMAMEVHIGGELADIREVLRSLSKENQNRIAEIDALDTALDMLFDRLPQTLPPNEPRIPIGFKKD